MNLRRRALERILTQAERAVALLDRCRATNARSERERVLLDWRAGRRSAPELVYPDIPDLGEVRASLESIAETCALAGGWGRLYAERALELACEAAAVERIGRSDFRQRAAERYPVDRGPDGAQCEALARSWCREAPPPDLSNAVQSDDERDPDSLISALRRAVGLERLPFRVVASAELPCAAATGDGILLVRMGILLRPQDVRRIVLHEIEAHALPRTRARGERLGLYRIGTARGSDDEEGRALLLEERAGLLDAHRRAELGRRHLAALSVRQGADWVETVELLLELGTELAPALDLASRAHRGGGLGREVVYLTAFLRVRRAVSRDPGVESWMRRGRIAVDAIPALSELGEPPELLSAKNAAA